MVSIDRDADKVEKASKEILVGGDDIKQRKEKTKK